MRMHAGSYQVYQSDLTLRVEFQPKGQQITPDFCSFLAVHACMHTWRIL